jgi:hypothetical protein
MQKKFTQKNRPNLHFSVTFLRITFFLLVFLQLFNGFEISLKFKPFFKIILALFANLEVKRGRNSSNVFCECVVELKCETSTAWDSQVVKIVVP